MVFNTYGVRNMLNSYLICPWIFLILKKKTMEEQLTIHNMSLKIHLKHMKLPLSPYFVWLVVHCSSLSN